MKKIAFLISLAAVVLAGCSKPEIDAPVAEEVTYNTVLTAEIPQTKVAIDAEYTKLTWNNGDKISVLTSAGTYKEFVYTGEDGSTSAEFKGTLADGETVAGYAIYPAHAQHAVVEGRPSVYLSAEHAWKAAEVKGPMVAAITEGTASFSHAGGLFAFDVTGMPAGAKGFKFETNGVDVTGSFAYGEDKILKTAEGQNTAVTMTFDALEEATAMRFHVPVPTGSYEGFTISYINAEGMAVEIRSASATNVIEAATVKYFTVEVAESGAWYVKADGSATASGLSWANATTLTNALDKAEDGDVIFVGAGTYVPETHYSGVALDADGNPAIEDEVTTATGDAQKAFIVDKNVAILGGYPAAGGSTCDPEANATILSGNDVINHVVLVSVAEQSEGKVKMSGFTITGAKSSCTKVDGVETGDVGKWSINGTVLEDYSGALAVVGANTTLALENMKFTGNNTVNASAMYSSDATVNVKKCIFTENTASGNGTVLFSSGSKVNFSDSQITDNEAANGAGLYLFVETDTQMSGSVSNVIIKNNDASESGGGVWIRARSVGQLMNVTLDNCTIVGNSSAEGAAIKLSNTKGVIIKNTTVKDHTGGGSVGGVMSSIDASTTYENCNFTSNGGTANGLFLVKAENVETTNIYNKCIWSSNRNENFQGVLYAFSKEGTCANNVVILNSLFKSNYSKGRGGAIMSYCTGPKIDVKCVNTTFNDNTSTGQGSAINVYSANVEYVSNVDIISCTITANSTLGKYAVYAETTTGATANIYNSLITGNGSNGAYDVGRSGGSLVRKNSWMTKYSYDTDGVQTNLSEGEYFDYATMLGALNTDGVCPLLLPATNPAVTGGMTSSELSALASTNVPASVLTKDQLGNDRTGKVIGAYVGGLTQSQQAL